MKFVIDKNKLIEAITITSKAISPKNPRPIFTGIKFELNNNGLFLTGVDNDISIVHKIPLKDKNGEDNIVIFEQGIFLVSGRFINEIVKGMQDDKITLESMEENVVRISDSTSRFSLNCMDYEEYPTLDVSSQGTQFILDTKSLSAICNEIGFAASEKDGRAILTGVNLNASQGKMQCVATDSYRIARKTLSINTQSAFNVTIPAKTLLEIGRIGENEDEVDITVAERKIIFKFFNTIVIARIINGAYPDITRLIPTNFTNKIIAPAASFVGGIDRVSKLATDRNNTVRLSMSHSNCSVSSRSQESGAGTIDVAFTEFVGPDLDITFTSRYVVEAIRALGSENIEIKFDGDIKPFLVSKKDDDSIIQLILPVRTY